MSGDYFSSLCLLLLFFMIVSSPVPASGSQDDCVELPPCERIGDENWSGFVIRFPFRLGNFQPDHCGLPGFNLSCTSNNETVLDLPKHSKTRLYVKQINYEDQDIQVDVPDYLRSSETRRSLKLLDLSATHFQFTFPFSLIALMNCSGKVPLSDKANSMRCFRDNDINSQNSTIRAVISSSHVEGKPEFINCTKMYSYTAPVDPYSELYVNSFSLTWVMPGCEACKMQSKICVWNNKSSEFECFKREGKQKEAFPSSLIPTVHKTTGYSPIKSIVTAVSTVGSFFVLVVAVVAFYLITLDRKDRESRLRIEKFLQDYTAFKPSRYKYSDIKKITDQFKVKLGQGAYGTVFKGKLSSDVLVAVKILTNNITGNGEEFINEVATMGRIHHVNVVRLVGYCADGFRRALIFEFLPNYSLEKYISRATSSTTSRPLSWEKLQGISLGIAKGIDYLHRGCDQRILHFDIKPHNILLDRNFTPKICDFGLAKLCSKDQSIVSMSMTRGTMGYIAPEVFSRNFGNVSYKSDVYSFGMLLLEMVAGRKNTAGSEEDEIYYPEWIYNLLEEGEDLRIEIDEEGDLKIAKRLAIVGLWCIQWHPAGRPTMKLAVQMLEGKDGGELTMPPNPFASAVPSKMTTKIPTRRIAFELEAIAE